MPTFLLGLIASAGIGPTCATARQEMEGGGARRCNGKHGKGGKGAKMGRTRGLSVVVWRTLSLSYLTMAHGIDMYCSGRGTVTGGVSIIDLFGRAATLLLSISYYI